MTVTSSSISTTTPARTTARVARLGEHADAAEPQHVVREHGEVVLGDALEDLDARLTVARLHLRQRGGGQVDHDLRVGAELGVALPALRIDAEDRDAALDRLAPVLPELAELLRSARRSVPGVKDQHDAFAAQIRQGHAAAGIVRQGEVRGARAHRQRIGEEPGKHHGTVIWIGLLCSRLTDNSTVCAPEATPGGSFTFTW